MAARPVCDSSCRRYTKPHHLSNNSSEGYGTGNPSLYVTAQQAAEDQPDPFGHPTAVTYVSIQRDERQYDRNDGIDQIVRDRGG